MSIEGWDEVAQRVARDHRVIRYDVRGFGLSEKVRGVVTMDEEVGDLDGLLDALGVKEPVTLVGGALGASIALSYAAAHPAKVRAVYALSPVVPLAPESSAAPVKAPAPSGPSPVEILAKQGTRAYLDAQEEELYPARLRTAGRYARFRAIQLSGDPIGRVATVKMVSGANVAAVLPQIDVPVNFVATSLFKLQPPKQIARLARLAPRGQLEILPTGHLAALASPDLVASSIRAFLRQTGG